jgi:hypothetical protein
MPRLGAVFDGGGEERVVPLVRGADEGVEVGGWAPLHERPQHGEGRLGGCKDEDEVVGLLLELIAGVLVS